MTNCWPLRAWKRKRSASPGVKRVARAHELVRLAGDDLAVDHGRQRNGRLGLGGWPQALEEPFRIDERFRLGLAEFGQPADVERQGIGQPARRLDPQFAPPGSASAATAISTETRRPRRDALSLRMNSEWKR